MENLFCKFGAGVESRKVLCYNVVECNRNLSRLQINVKKNIVYALAGIWGNLREMDEIR